jgi:hypothetical protein
MAVRLTSDGALDATFGNGGIAITDFDGGNDTGNAVAIAPVTGKIIVAGSTQREYGTDLAMVRYLD